MQSQKSFRFFFFGLLALLVSINLSFSKSVYSFSPETVNAEQAFSLKLSATDFTCASEFTHKSASISEARIDLYFVYSQTKRWCPDYLQVPDVDIVRPNYGPSFSIPALKPGVYAVYASRMPPCAVCESVNGKPCAVCEIAIIPEIIGKLLVEEQGAVAYMIDPKSIEAGMANKLSLLSYQFFCANRFDNMAVSTSGKNIYLTFHTTVLPNVMCPLIYKPYGTTFEIPALKTGTYSVHAIRLADCQVSQPACKIGIQPVFVDTLQVLEKPVVKDQWHLMPERAIAYKSFNLDVFNDRYGSCQTEFSNLSVSSGNYEIHLSATHKSFPDRVCIMNKIPFGPSYTMGPMAPGSYKVSITISPDCGPNVKCQKPVEEYAGKLEIGVPTGIKVLNKQPKNNLEAFLTGQEATRLQWDFYSTDGKKLSGAQADWTGSELNWIGTDPRQSLPKGLVIVRSYAPTKKNISQQGLLLIP